MGQEFICVVVFQIYLICYFYFVFVGFDDGWDEWFCVEGGGLDKDCFFSVFECGELGGVLGIGEGVVGWGFVRGVGDQCYGKGRGGMWDVRCEVVRFGRIRVEGWVRVEGRIGGVVEQGVDCVEVGFVCGWGEEGVEVGDFGGDIWIVVRVGWSVEVVVERQGVDIW